MSLDDGFEEATINPLSTFRRKWPVAGMPDAPQVVVWQFKLSAKSLTKFEVTFHPAADGDLDDNAANAKSGGGGGVFGAGRARADSWSWPGGKNSKPPSSPSLRVRNKQNQSPLFVRSKHEQPTNRSACFCAASPAEAKASFIAFCPVGPHGRVESSFIDQHHRFYSNPRLSACHRINHFVWLCVCACVRACVRACAWHCHCQ